jgi:hypothetical protein
LYVLSSPGKFSKRGASFLRASISGKLTVLERYFPDSRPIFGNEKYLCANQNSILIDDNPEQINKFAYNGGNTFLWPHEYIVQDLGYELFKQKCIDKIRNMSAY